jgi:hypothetical protein
VPAYWSGERRCPRVLFNDWLADDPFAADRQFA